MPDKWEYPWYAAWDLAFHTVSLALVDPDFAEEQLVLLTREWYMHPNGQLPAYEWAFGDVNPPVHGWATWRVFQMDRKRRRLTHPNDPGRPGISRARVPQADAELHLVGQPEGRRRPQRLPGRLPRAGQHRRLRSQRAAADRRLHQPVRRHELDGDVQPQPDAHRARAGPAQSRLRRHRHQVLRALPAHRRSDDQRRRRHGPVERRGRLLLRRPQSA